LAELAAPTKLLFQFIYKKGRAGCRKTTAIQFISKNGRAGCANKTAFHVYIYKKRQSRLSKNNCNTIYFKKMAELAAPTKLLYNMCVLHIISHFFGGI
jgi:hypothetical protein